MYTHIQNYFLAAVCMNVCLLQEGVALCNDNNPQLLFHYHSILFVTQQQQQHNVFPTNRTFQPSNAEYSPVQCTNDSRTEGPPTW